MFVLLSFWIFEFEVWNNYRVHRVGFGTWQSCFPFTSAWHHVLLASWLTYDETAVEGLVWNGILNMSPDPSRRHSLWISEVMFRHSSVLQLGTLCTLPTVRENKNWCPEMWLLPQLVPGSHYNLESTWKRFPEIEIPFWRGLHSGDMNHLRISYPLLYIPICFLSSVELLPMRPCPSC